MTRTKNPKMKILPKTKKLIPTSDFSLGRHGGWGGVSNKMRMIGSFRVVKGKIEVMIFYVSL